MLEVVVHRPVSETDAANVTAHSSHKNLSRKRSPFDANLVSSIFTIVKIDYTSSPILGTDAYLDHEKRLGRLEFRRPKGRVGWFLKGRSGMGRLRLVLG